MDSKDRLSDLAALLQSGKRNLTRKYLEKRWNCTKITVHRIMARGRETGIPIVFEGGSYRLEEGKAFEVRGFWLQPEELAALLGLAHWLEILGSGVLKDKLTPIQTRLEEMLRKRGMSTADWKERIRLLPMHFRPIDPDTLLASARSVLMRKRITFLYTGVKDSKPRKREVSPQTLVRYRDNWYLDAHDHDSKKLRAFALSRMSDFETLAASSKDISREVLDAYFGDAYGMFTGRAGCKAVLLFEGLAAKLAGEEHWHPRQKTRLLPEGKVRLEFPCGNVRELARDVMRFADEVTVEGPEELRREMEGMLKRAAERIGPGRKFG